MNLVTNTYLDDDEVPSKDLEDLDEEEEEEDDDDDDLFFLGVIT